jgi:hypothetical protein
MQLELKRAVGIEHVQLELNTGMMQLELNTGMMQLELKRAVRIEAGMMQASARTLIMTLRVLQDDILW